MKIDVYDTYAKSRTDSVIHFDVLVAQGTSRDDAFAYARQWLASIGENAENLSQSRCTFCHSEQANPVVQDAIHREGHYILQMEGCPHPII
ncbi:MAG TPA: DUF2024 family protein [Micavibrio sp.]